LTQLIFLYTRKRVLLPLKTSWSDFLPKL
jgi:hypothetical protein